MHKLVTVALLSLIASFGVLDAAYAKKPSHHQAWLDSLKAKGAAAVGGEITEVGEAFLPNESEGDPKAECIAGGGTPKNQIESDGSIGVRCLPGGL